MPDPVTPAVGIIFPCDWPLSCDWLLRAPTISYAICYGDLCDPLCRAMRAATESCDARPWGETWPWNGAELAAGGGELGRVGPWNRGAGEVGAGGTTGPCHAGQRASTMSAVVGGLPTRRPTTRVARKVPRKGGTRRRRDNGSCGGVPCVSASKVNVRRGVATKVAASRQGRSRFLLSGTGSRPRCRAGRHACR